MRRATVFASTAALLVAGCAQEPPPAVPVATNDPTRQALVHDATVLTHRLTGRDPLPRVEAADLAEAARIRLTPPNYVHAYTADPEPVVCLANETAGVWVVVRLRTGIITSPGTTLCDEDESTS